MNKVIRKVALIALSVIMATCLCVGLVACDNETSYTITIEPSTHGTITSNVSEAKAEETVTLTISPEQGYHLATLLINDAPQTVSGTTATFTMPEQNVVVKGTFEQDVVIPDDAAKEALPSSNSIQLSSKATGGATATSHWSIVYGETGLEVTVYVEDVKLIDGEDAVALYVGRAGYDYVTLGELNIGVKVYADKTVEQYQVISGAYAKTSEEIVTASAVVWTNNTSKIAGYKATITVPYTVLGLTAKADAEGQITALPVLYNLDVSGGAITATPKAYEGNDIDNPGSYPVLTSDNTLKKNDYAGGMGQLGSSSKITASNTWDLSKDYAEGDTANYPNRQAVLRGHDGNDNNLVFWRTEGANAYAKATIRVDNILNGEKYGKFGLMLFDGANQTGVFFFVDALVGEGRDVNVDNIQGTSVGCNVADGGWDSAWPIVANNKFDTTTKSITMAMTYIDGIVRLYVGNELVHQTTYTSRGDVVIGIKSFNYELTVTDYESSGDTTDAIFRKESHAITATEYADVTYEIQSTAKLHDEVSFTINADGKTITHVYVNYGSEKIELHEAGGCYTFTMPDEAVTITVEFENLLTVDMTAVSDKLEVSNSAPSEGEEVTFTAKEGWAIDKLYYNNTELLPQDGEYKLVVTENVVITGKFFVRVGDMVLDGKVDEGYGDTVTVANYNDNRSLTLHAVRTTEGVWIHIVAVMNSRIDNGDAWWDNTNFEFFLNGKQYYINIKNQTSGGLEYVWKTEQGGKYTYTVEVHVPEEKEWGDELQLTYAWKSFFNGNGDNGYVIGNAIGHTHVSNDTYFGMHEIGGAVDGTYSEIGYNGRVKNLFVNSNGLRQVTERATATNGTIDGNLEEFADKAYIDLYGGPMSVRISGYTAADGLYLGFTVTHNAWSSFNQGDWSQNDNIELRINDAATALVWVDGQLRLPLLFAEAKSVTVNGDNGKLITTAEVFIPGSESIYTLRVGKNGSGFGGWSPLLWDNNFMYISAQGVTGSDSEALAKGIVLDGNFTESVWTEDVKSKAITSTVDGATVTVIGVNTDAGILLGVTIDHTKPVTEAVQNVGDQWWHMMNFEMRLGGRTGDPDQLAVSVFRGRDKIGNLQAGLKTEGNGPYTTTMEILIKYDAVGKSKDESIELCMAIVSGSGFHYLFESTGWGDAKYYVTSNGIVAK